jgi:type VI secretion system protein ImpK
LPLWVTSLVAAALLAVLYFSLALSLGEKSDRVYAQLAALRPEKAASPQPLPASQPRLADLLSASVAAQRLTVRDEIDRSVVVLPDEALFEAGTAALRTAGLESLRPVAAALQSTPGRVLVVGHTDGKATRSARYPSDWDLSVDRARSVHDALRALGVGAARLRFDGRADTEPLMTTGATPLSSGNGRIEIVLLAGR